MKNKIIIINWLVTIIGAIIIFIFFYRFLPSHLLHREQTQLFLFSSQNFSDYFRNPSVLSCLLGDFLTQFFYYRWIGSLILTILLISMGSIFYHLLQPIRKGWALLFVILLIVWEFVKQCGIAYPLSATLSFIGGGVIALLFISNRHSLGRWSAPFLMISLILSYWLFGIGMWITLLFTIRFFKLYMVGILFLEAIILPILARNIYPLAWYEIYTYPSTSQFDYPDFKRERALKYDCAFYLNQTDQLLTSPNEDTSGHLETYYSNLNDALNGQLSTNLLNRIDYNTAGLFLPVSSTSNYYTIYAANEVWFALGDMTMAEHATLLGMIFSPNSQGSRAIKRLAEINLINKDDDAAMKYLRMLQKTLFYKDWANQRIPGQQTEKVKEWLAYKQQFIHKSDTLRTSTDIPTSLKSILNANPNNVLALEYLLSYDLLKKDIPNFVNDFEQYSNGYSSPVLFQEAYLIHLAYNNLTSPQSSKMNITDDVFNEYYRYNQLYRISNADLNQLKHQFKDSYWFYYHFAKKLD